MARGKAISWKFMMGYDPAMAWDLWGTETWFRIWRYGPIRLWMWPVHWKGWLAIGIQTIAGGAATVLLINRNPNDPLDPLWLILAPPTIVLGWLTITRADVV